jgi:hypothetical protein
MILGNQSHLDCLWPQQIVIFYIDLVGLPHTFSEAKEFEEKWALLATTEEYISLAAD